ncbi:hypothetical protein [Vallicoccus soli]|uniref:hypothetical protein n=1 Tax=Vallicoccus soli TaxID=2339232 RepID=UPI00105AA3A1|nr:hypothetical protein [Vallicoccus soli]
MRPAPEVLHELRPDGLTERSVGRVLGPSAGGGWFVAFVGGGYAGVPGLLGGADLVPVELDDPFRHGLGTDPPLAAVRALLERHDPDGTGGGSYALTAALLAEHLRALGTVGWAARDAAADLWAVRRVAGSAVAPGAAPPRPLLADLAALRW